MKSSSRLKNFCELCRKQCRDENGYLCHVNSVSHQRKVQQFKTNPEQLIGKFSQEMQGKFIQLLKTKYPGQPKHLEVMYNQYEQQAKRFIKFSHTRWKNLKQFGQYLGSGQAKNIKITGTPPDCYVTYTVNKTMDFIDKNKKQQIEALRQKEKQLFQKSLQNRIQRQKLFQERQAQKFEEQMRKVEKQREDLIIPDKLQFNFQHWGESGKRNAFITTQQLQKQAEMQINMAKQSLQIGPKKLQNNQKLLNQIISEQEKKQKRHKKLKNQTDNITSKGSLKKQDQNDEVEWILPGIVVKIKPHEIDPAFHNKKTRILQVVEPYIAKVTIGTATLQIDQVYLQTVIPKINNQVMVLNGDYKRQIGTLEHVDLMAGFGTLSLGQQSLRIPFNYFSKYQRD